MSISNRVESRPKTVLDLLQNRTNKFPLWCWSPKESVLTVLFRNKVYITETPTQDCTKSNFSVISRNIYFYCFCKRKKLSIFSVKYIYVPTISVNYFSLVDYIFRKNMSDMFLKFLQNIKHSSISSVQISETLVYVELFFKF